MWITRVFFLVILCVILINAKKYERRCQLVRDLIRSGMPNNIFLGQWVCLIEKVSKRDTSAFVTTPSGKKFYGLYQIPSRWCKVGKRGGDCNIKCESLLDDDIKDDTVCADLIFRREGFKYWPLWTIRCKNDMTFTTEIYNASGMFAAKRVDCVHTVMRKRAASLVRRLRVSANTVLAMIAGRVDCPYTRHYCNRHALKIPV